MQRLWTVVLTLIAIVGWLGCVFFGYFGVRLVHEALTYEGEGSLGHVGMYIAAGLYPVLALLSGGIGYLAGRARRRGRHDIPPV
jgi:hypothetical protein